jgi:hypothetical protein
LRRHYISILQSPYCPFPLSVWLCLQIALKHSVSWQLSQYQDANLRLDPLSCHHHAAY